MTHVSDLILICIIAIAFAVWWCKKNFGGSKKKETIGNRIARQKYMYSLIAPDELVKKTRVRLDHRAYRNELIKEFDEDIKSVYGSEYKNADTYVDFNERTSNPRRTIDLETNKYYNKIMVLMAPQSLDYWLYLLAIAKAGYLPEKEFNSGIELGGFRMVCGMTEIVTNIRFCQIIEKYLLAVNPYATVGFTRGYMSRNNSNPVMLDMAYGRCSLDAFLMNEDWKFWEAERKGLKDD